MLPRGHKTARTSQFSRKQGHEPMLLLRFIRNVISAVHCVQPYSAPYGDVTGLYLALSELIFTLTDRIRLFVHDKSHRYRVTETDYYDVTVVWTFQDILAISLAKTLVGVPVMRIRCEV